MILQDGLGSRNHWLHCLKPDDLDMLPFAGVRQTVQTCRRDLCVRAVHFCHRMSSHDAGTLGHASSSCCTCNTSKNNHNSKDLPVTPRVVLRLLNLTILV